MFEVGFTELLLICVIALLVLGPQKLPKLAAQVGRWMGRARTMARQFRDQLEEESIFEETKSTSKPAAKNQAANSIAPPAIAATADPVADDAPASSTLTTGVPPDDDFAHHDIASHEATGGSDQAPLVPSTDEPDKA